MSQAKLREALSAGASSREKGSPVPDGVLTATSESAEGSEWRSRRSIIDAIASKSSYLDEPGDNTECRSSLYGRFTWRLDKFSEVTKRELRSSTFQVGQYKWYILVYPQGCDVTNHLSLFLCVANYDKLLPGWSHFAQFTIAVINKDPKKSKYSDTLHRFCKKEHDWGWKKFIDLGKLADGFTFADSLVIKAQVQVIPDCPPRPVCTLDTRYRRELVRVYLSNVEGIVRRFVEEKKPLLNRLVGPQALKGFSAFWEELEEEKRISLLSVSAPTVFKSLVKRFFNEKEVTSTLMMDGLYSGAKELELGFHGRHPGESRSGSGSGQGTEGEQSMTMVIDASSNRFLFVDIKGALTLLEKLSLMESVVPVVHCNDPVHPARADNDGGGGGGGGSGADEEGSITDVHDHSISDQDRSSAPQAGDKTSTRDCLDHDECRLANLGRVTLEVFAACYIAETQLEPAWVEAEIIKRQEALIREEEEAERGEAERAAAKAEAEKERRARKKERQRAKKEAERAKKEAEEAERLRQEEQKRAETERRRAELEEKAAERRLKENSAKENGKRAGIINTSPKISANLAEINGNDDKNGDKNGSGKTSDGESLKRSTAEKTVQPVHQTESIGLVRLPVQNPTASGAATRSSSQIECEEDVKVSLMEKLSSLKSECEEKDKIIAQLRARIDELEGRNAVLGRGAAPPGRDLPENGRMSLDVVMTQPGQSKAGDTVNRQSLPRQSSAPGLAQQATRIPLVHQPQFPSSSMMTSSHAASTGAGLSTGHAGHAVYAPPPQQIYHAGGASTVPVFSATSTATGSRSSSSSSSALLVGVVGTDAVPGTGVQIPLAQPTAPPVGSRTFSSPLPDTNRSKLCQSNGIATDSSGLDDFAHMGLITDLLE